MATTATAPNDKLDVEPMLVVSIAHISQCTVDFLSTFVEDRWPAPLPRLIPHTYGFIFHVPLEEDLDEEGCAALRAALDILEIDPTLLTLLVFARAHGCDWLNLDTDGSQIDGISHRDDLPGEGA